MRGKVEESESDTSESSFNLRKIWDLTVNIVAATMTVYLILISVEPSRHFLERYIGEISIELIAAIVAIMFEIAIVTLTQLSRQVRAARLAVETRTPEAVMHDIGEVMTDMRYRLKDRVARRKVDILGLTLNTTWPQLAPLLNAEDLPSGCELNLYCLNSAFAVESNDLPNGWSDESARLQRRINAFATRDGERLAQNNISIHLRMYSCVPIVHGFRYGDGTLFISFLQWRADGVIQPFVFYECITPKDTSQRATNYRKLFDSWIKRVSSLSDNLPVANI